MARRDDAKLTPVARFGQPHVRDMRFDVEMLILHPIGIVDIKRQPMQPAFEDRRAINAALDLGDDVLESHAAARRRRWVVDIDAHHVRERIGGLRVQKLRVLGT